MEKAFTSGQLHEMWKRPPERQIQIAQAKIMEAIMKADGKIQISWSGGKDSTFLLFLYCMIIQDYPQYKNEPINVVFADTTNETKGIYKFIKFFPTWLEQRFGVAINLITVKPQKRRKPITMIELVKEIGLPMISKETATKISKIRKSMKENNVSFSQIEHYLNPTPENRDYLWGLGLNQSTTLALLGWSCRADMFGKRGILAKKWYPFLWDDAPEISAKCCDCIKKEPINRIKFNGVQMTGEMAEESELRKQRYLITGCNGAILSNGTGTSKPLGAMTNQGLLFGIRHYNVPISDDYGEIIEENQCLKCSGEQRTGCSLCGFGIVYDWSRFVRLKETEPAKTKYAFTPKEQGGLGFLEVCEYINKHCKGKIQIPIFNEGGEHDEI